MRGQPSNLRDVRLPASVEAYAPPPLGYFSCPVLDVLDAKIESLPTPFRMVQRPQGAAISVDGRIATGVVTILFDHALGCCIGLAAPPFRATTTLELRIDWLADVEPDLPVQIEACNVRFSGRIAVADAIATQDDGRRVLAIARGHFILGIHPGGSASDPIDWAKRQICNDSDFDNFEAFLDIYKADDAISILPRERFQGATTVQAYHGGIVAALMDHAARQSADIAAPQTRPVLRSLTVQYLRPSIATAPLFITSRTVRRGRTAATLATEARCGSRDAPVTAIGVMTFLAELPSEPENGADAMVLDRNHAAASR